MARTKSKWKAEATRLGDAVRAARSDRELSQQALAEEARISISAVRNLEQGISSDPGVFEVAAMARALQVSLDELVGAATTEAAPA